MIQLKDINYSYKGSQNPALSEINAQIGAGIYLLLGENGAGKTTLLELIAGLLFPKSGECLVEGEPSSERKPVTMSSLFFLPEEITLSYGTLAKMVKYHSPLYPTFSQEVLDDCLAEFGLTGNESIRTLSLGNRKKCNLSYAIALKTPILLLDEPANGLDIESKKTLRKLLARHIDETQTVIISTHTVWDLATLFESVIVLNKSKMLISESVADITKSLAFVVTEARPDNALYTECDINGWHSIVPNVDGRDTMIDYTILYGALCSNCNQAIRDAVRNSIPQKISKK